jgi:hypothetical protein
VRASLLHHRAEILGGELDDVGAAVDNLLLQGMRSLLVWVLAANPYRRFYESLGGQPVRSRSLRIGGRRLEETGYGWETIKPLVPPFILPLP